MKRRHEAPGAADATRRQQERAAAPGGPDGRGRWRRLDLLLPLAGLGLLAVVLLRTAWVCDDAYISYRVIDNLWAGHGLRWNVAERVQPFTHPLWLALNAALFGVTREVFLSGMLLGVGVSLLAAATLTFGLVRDRALATGALLLLVGSRAFVDYCTSGLENPLTHGLLAGALWVHLEDRGGRRALLGLAALVGLGLLNRLDTALLFGPLLAAAAWRRRRRLGPALGWICLGLTPWLLWEGLSLVYYGFPFPNTAYAKLGTGLPVGALAKQGLHYLEHTLRRDPGTALVLLAGLGWPLYRRSPRCAAPLLGVVLYLAYVVRIGGDFMGGRFLSAPVFVLVALLGAGLRGPAPPRATQARPAWLPSPRWLVLAGTAAVVAVAWTGPRTPIRSGPDYGEDRSDWKDEHGIADERRYYFRHSSLAAWRAHPGRSLPSHPYAKQGRAYREQQVRGPRVHGSVGFRGYFGGPGVHIIDYYALTDPLLARLPARRDPDWRIGHFTRRLPGGYQGRAAAGATGLNNRGTDRCWAELLAVTRGPLWSRKRWESIWRLNRHGCRPWIDARVYERPRRRKRSRRR